VVFLLAVKVLFLGGVSRLEERYVSVAWSNSSSEIFTFISFVYTDLESSILSVISVELER